MSAESTSQDQPNKTAPAIIGLQHLAINVKDLGDAERFYGELLGLPVLPRPEAVAAGFRSQWYLLGNAELHVVENPDFEPLKSPLGPHFAVACNDFDGFIKALQNTSAEVVFGPGIGIDGINRMVVKDPTGNIVEIIDLPLHG